MFPKSPRELKSWRPWEERYDTPHQGAALLFQKSPKSSQKLPKSSHKWQSYSKCSPKAPGSSKADGLGAEVHHTPLLPRPSAFEPPRACSPRVDFWKLLETLPKVTFEVSAAFDQLLESCTQPVDNFRGPGRMLLLSFWQLLVNFWELGGHLQNPSQKLSKLQK